MILEFLFKYFNCLLLFGKMRYVGNDFIRFMGSPVQVTVFVPFWHVSSDLAQ